MPTLEQIIESKQQQFNLLQRKYDSLQRYGFAIAYDMNPYLEIDEQIYWAQQGLYWLWYDINNYRDKYNCP